MVKRIKKLPRCGSPHLQRKEINLNCYLPAILASLVLASASPAQTTPERKYDGLNVGSQIYPNACTQKARKTTRAALTTAGTLAPDRAWQLIDALLCAEATDSNRRLIQGSLAKLVRSRDESTGTEPIVKKLRPSEQLAASLASDGKVWNLEVEAQADSITLHFYSDEATIKSITLEYLRKAWIVIDIDQASD